MEDAQELVSVHYKAVHNISQEFYSGETLNSWSPTPSQERIDWLAEVISNPNSIGYVSVASDGEIVGFVILFLHEEVIQALYVDPRYSGFGIGTSLLNLVQEKAHILGINKLSLKASLNAAGFYEEHGYKVVGMGEHQLRDGSVMAAIVMEKLLDERV